VLSGTGTPENNKEHALRAFKPEKHRVEIEFFCRPLNGKRKLSFLCALCVFAVKNVKPPTFN